MKTKIKWKRVIGIVTVLLYFSIQLGAGLAYYYINHLECLLYTKYGIKCVSCGGSHMILNIIHGDIIGAIKCNIFLFVTLLFLPFFFGYNIIYFYKSGELPDEDISIAITLCVIGVLFMIVRNII